MEAVVKGQVYFWAIGEHKEAPAGGCFLFEVIFLHCRLSDPVSLFRPFLKTRLFNLCLFWSHLSVYREGAHLLSLYSEEIFLDGNTEQPLVLLEIREDQFPVLLFKGNNLTPVQLFFIHLLKGIPDIDGAPGCQGEKVRAWAPANFYAERYFWAMGYLLP